MNEGRLPCRRLADSFFLRLSGIARCAFRCLICTDTP